MFVPDYHIIEFEFEIFSRDSQSVWQNNEDINIVNTHGEYKAKLEMYVLKVFESQRLRKWSRSLPISGMGY